MNSIYIKPETSENKTTKNEVVNELKKSNAISVQSQKLDSLALLFSLFALIIALGK